MGTDMMTMATRDVPSTIDHSTLAPGDGSANDVYHCGKDALGMLSMKQMAADMMTGASPAGPGWADATAPDTKPCLNLGGHQGYNDTFSPMTMKNMFCTKTMYVICREDGINTATSSHSGNVDVTTSMVDMTSVNVDIVKAAFDATYTPVVSTEAPVTEAPEAAGGNMMRNIIIVVVVLAIIGGAFFALK